MNDEETSNEISKEEKVVEVENNGSKKEENLNEKDKVEINNNVENINNKKALGKLMDFVGAQGGNVDYIKNPELFAKAKEIIPVYAKTSGCVVKYDRIY